MERLLDDSQASSTDIAAVVRGQLRAVAKDSKVTSDPSLDEMTRLHLDDVVDRIDRILGSG